MKGYDIEYSGVYSVKLDGIKIIFLYPIISLCMEMYRIDTFVNDR